MTGLTEQMRDDNKLMRDVNSSIRTDAPVKIKECLKLFDILTQNP
jgi:hypothetical protein